MVEFVKWPKIPRGNPLEVTITEKIDGTNACVIVENGVVVGCQSRNRLITPTYDNHGFAAWVWEHKEELAPLGDGHHFGEWAGPGIQKNPMGLQSKRFYLFNSYRWNNEPCPACCAVVPVLYKGYYSLNAVYDCLLQLAGRGYEPEGVVVYFHLFGKYVKVTFDNPEGKWKTNSRAAEEVII